MIIDSHCHIYDEKLSNIKDEILLNLMKSSQKVVCCADNIENSEKCVELAKNSSNVFAGVGIHPECVESLEGGYIKILEEMAKNNSKVVAIGEIGLDYHYDDEIAKKVEEELKEKNIDCNNIDVKKCIDKAIEENHNKQKIVLINQIYLAQKLGLPCIFHVRDATGDFVEILRKLEKDFYDKNKVSTVKSDDGCKDKLEKFSIKGVVHSFSGSFDVAQIYIKYGLFLGINGVVTFKNARNLVEVVKKLPLEKMVVETDCPYLTPEPFRGKVNRPEYVEFVAKKIAEIKNLSVDEVVSVTTQNAIKLFDLKF